MSDAVPHEGIDAVGLEKSEPRRWYIAIVNNKSERLCQERLEQRIADQPADKRDYEVYVATQKKCHVTASGKRTLKERIVLRALVFICCTDSLRGRRSLIFLTSNVLWSISRVSGRVAYVLWLTSRTIRWRT